MSWVTLTVDRFHSHDEKHTCNAGCQHEPIPEESAFLEKQHRSEHNPGWSKILQPDRVCRRTANDCGEIGPIHCDKANRHRHHRPMQRRFANQWKQKQQRKACSPKRNGCPANFCRPSVEQLCLGKKPAGAPEHCRRDDQDNALGRRASSSCLDR